MEFAGREMKQTNHEKNQKKILNKKKWREQKYNTKAKVLKWENRKRMQALTKYKRELKKSGIEFSDSHKFQKTKMNTESALKKAQLQYEKIQEQKLQKRKERELEMEKKKKKIEEYHEQKKIRYKKLYGNSKPGKMSMKGRLELLLEKVQKVCADTPEVS